MRRVLVTGAAGFIGSSVVDRLLDAGDHVTALDNFDPYYDPAQKRRNVARALGSSRYRLHELDIRDAAGLRALFEQASPELVVHLAALAGVRNSVEDPKSYVEVNELGGLYVLQECVRAGQVPLVYASTSSVYGRTAKVPFREDDHAGSPLSPYAASKRAGELMAAAFRQIHGLPVAILRFFTVYGPRGRPDMALHRFTEALRRGKPLPLYGETTERDFTYIDDIVDGVAGAMDWLVRTRGFDTFNLGRSEPVRVRRLIELLSKELGKKPEIVLGTLATSEALYTAANVDKAKSAFGYDPRVSLEEGVKRWVTWVDQSHEAPVELR